MFGESLLGSASAASDGSMGSNSTWHSIPLIDSTESGLSQNDCASFLNDYQNNRRYCDNLTVLNGYLRDHHVRAFYSSRNREITLQSRDAEDTQQIANEILQEYPEWLESSSSCSCWTWSWCSSNPNVTIKIKTPSAP